MEKTFIWWICSTCNEPIGILEPCKELGYNAFPTTNFHGELSHEETEELKQQLMKLLREKGREDDAKTIEINTRVITVTFKL